MQEKHVNKQDNYVFTQDYYCWQTHYHVFKISDFDMNKAAYKISVVNPDICVSTYAGRLRCTEGR